MYIFWLIGMLDIPFLTACTSNIFTAWVLAMQSDLRRYTVVLGYVDRDHILATWMLISDYLSSWNEDILTFRNKQSYIASFSIASSNRTCFPFLVCLDF